MTVPGEAPAPAPATGGGKPVAIFGGTFDPIHYGHLRAAAEVRDALGEVDFRLLPSGTPPHREAPHASADQRLAMLRLAVRHHPDFTIDDREISRQGPSYMVETLESLRAEQGAGALILILGQDAANYLDRWHRWQDLFGLCHLVVMTRPESSSAYSATLLDTIRPRRTAAIAALHESCCGYVLHLPVTQLAISSTDIRSQLAAGRNPRFLLPDAVLTFLVRHQLYRS